MLTLWAVPSSHPVRTVELALEHKGVPFRRVDLLPVLHRAVLAPRFGHGTVPAVTFDDGTRVQNSRRIIAALDERFPERPLVPGDPEAERAEEWGEQVLQPIARRLAWWCLGEQPAAMASYLEGTRTVPPSPGFVARPLAPVVARAARRLNGVDEASTRTDLRFLPSHLDRVDDWIGGGVLDGDALTAADLQIGVHVRFMLTFADLAPLIEERPCARLAHRVCPGWTGATPSGAVPPSWLQAA